MRKIYAAALVLAFSCSQAFAQSESQANGPVPGACMNGNPDPNAHTLPPSPQNGSGSLGLSYQNEQCGLNYVQASRKITTRYATPVGSGNPCTLTISGLPVCYQTVKAFVWANISYQGALPNPGCSITNPSNVTTPVAGTNIGTGPSKCWGETGCLTMRYDVTLQVAGNGNYTLNFTGLANPNWEIDGATLMIIYKNPAATYKGCITIADGCMVGIGSNYTQTLNGFNACAQSSAANAFLIVSDMQSNVNGNQHPSTLNGNTANYPNNFYNFDLVNTTVNAGQTTSAFGTNGLGSDCFQWSLMGLYYQTTTCTTCTNSALVLTTANTPASCSQCNGTATVTVTGGTAPYTYSWNTVPVQTTATATGLCPGTYTVTVTDATGCLTSQATVTIVSNSAALTVTSTMTPPLCNGQCNGSATASVLGGTAPYTYLWSPSGGNSPTGTGLCAGTYTCLVTDANGCTGQVIVNVTQPTAVTATQSQVNVTCNGACNGSASVVASGGTPGYTYSWAPSGGNTANATGLCAGTYTCTIKDANNCTITKVFTITQPTAITLTTTFTQATCNQANGTATVTITGGTPNYTINWSPSGGTNATATGLSAGNYTVTVTDANGCTRTATVTIPQAAGPAATLTSSTNVTCFNACNGTASVNVTGGQNPITFAWTPSGGNSANATGLCAGNYTCTVTDANGCTSTVTVTITQPTQLTLAVAGFNASCNGQCNGQGVCIPSGGTPGYTFNWTPSGGNNPSATGLCAGVYTCTVTDQNGCTASDTAIVGQPAALNANTTSTTSHCNQPDGTASVTVTGGTGPYTYAWSPSNQTSANATGLTPNTYTVTVTDFNGCTITASVVVPSTPAVTASISGSTNATCFGNCDGTANVTATGGNSPYTYAWAPSGGNTANATGLCAGTYTCTVTDQFGCSDSAVVTITQPTQVTVTTTQVNVSCNGGCNGTATATGAGGTAPYTYSWSNSQLTATATGLCAGNYTVYTTDANGCTGQVQVIITQPTLLSVTASANPAAICVGTQSSLSATGNGGTPNYTYNWMPGNLNGSAVTVSPVTTTTYTVTITDANGCTDTSAVTVTVNPLPVVSFTGPASGCVPLCVTLTNTTPNAVTSNWDFGDNSTGTGSPVNHCYTTPGVYGVTLVVTDANGCTNSLSTPNMFQVYAYPDAQFNFGPQPTTILNPTMCFTDSSTGATSWTWNFGDPSDPTTSNVQSPCHTYPDTGQYCVQLNVVNANGCADSIIHCLVIGPDFTLYVPNAFTPNGDGMNETFFPKGEGIDEGKYKMWIFDRWGNMIFYTEKWNSAGWDGHANDGKDIAQEDVYVWMIEIYDYLGKKHKYVGHVSLIK